MDMAVPAGGLTIRANVADQKDQRLVPGDVLYKHHRQAFERLPGPGRATEEQLIEHLYHQPCAVCKRAWGDPACKCATVP